MPLVESFSGIRGVFGKDLTEDAIMKYIFCFYKYLKKTYSKEPKIILGYDPRPSSEKIKQITLEIFNDIIDIGINTIPIVEFAVRKFKANGAVMITASHNEPMFNGLKFIGGDGALLRPNEIKEIIDNFQKIKGISEVKFYEKYLFKESRQISSRDKLKIHKIEVRHKEAIGLYTRYLKNFITSKEIIALKKYSPKILIDPNGGSGILAKEILENFGIKIVPINSKYGKFNRVIEPNEKSLKYLQRHINRYNALFAAGFDCDADRVEIVTRNGAIVNGNYILAMVVDEVLSNTFFPKKVNVVVSDATSTLIKKIAEKYNAIVTESEAGEINVLDEMLEYEAHVGGEGTSSGAIVPPNRCRDGIVTLLIILKMIANRKTTIEKIIEDYPKYYSARTKIKFAPKRHDLIKNNLKTFYLKKGFKIQETGDITGGLKIWVDKDNFIWYRASKTEGNYFRIIVDTLTKRDSLIMLKDAINVFNRFK